MKKENQNILQEVEENNCDRESNIENTIISIKDFDIANPNSLMDNYMELIILSYHKIGL